MSKNTIESNIQKFISPYLKCILNLIPEGVYISSHEGETLFVNDQWESLSGLAASEVIGKNVRRLVDEGIFTKIVNPDVVKTGTQRMIVQELNGRNVVITGHPVTDIDGRVDLVVTFVRDMTTFDNLKKEIMQQKELISIYQNQIAAIDPEDAFQKDGIVAVSRHSLELLEKVNLIAPTDATVLLLGETGVGKDVIARYIHDKSERANKQFLKFDCSSVSESLIESELFGYKGGAFSGASAKGKKGYFEQASGGTLFLDEVGELPLAMQTRLLRAINDHEIIRVGSTETVPIDVRIVAATNRNLKENVNDGTFRSDLYYRLKVAVINIKSIRERKDDILPLVKVFMKQLNTKYGKNIKFTNCAEQKLFDYSWPGNVREIKNTVHSIVVMAKDGYLKAEDLPSEFETISACNDTGSMLYSLDVGKKPLKSILASIERDIINDTIATYGSIGKAAEVLQVNRSTIFRKTKKKAD